MSEHQPDSPRQQEPDSAWHASAAPPQRPLPASRAGKEGLACRCPPGTALLLVRAHELKSCPSTSPTHPGSGNQRLPGVPPLLRREGRFPQAEQGRRQQHGGRATHRCDSPPHSARAEDMPKAPGPCSAAAWPLSLRVVLLHTGRLHLRRVGHAGRGRGGHARRTCHAFARPRRPRAGWEGGGGPNAFPGEEESNPCVSPRPMS